MELDQDEKKRIIAKFGDVNFDGLNQLESNYNTYQIDGSIDTIRDVVGILDELLVSLERLKSGAQELIDGDSDYCMESFSLEECGDIGIFAMEICDELNRCSVEIEKTCKRLAPLQRLMATEDNDVYIDYRDTLDSDKSEAEDDWS